MQKLFFVCFLIFTASVAQAASSADDGDANSWKVGPDHSYKAPHDHRAPSPIAVGWGNLFVPGLGATLRGNPVLGASEAFAEIGTYYGGTFMAQEAHFSMDGSVSVPSDDPTVKKQLTGQFLQEFGLKLHMYNTFYNYQQASLDPENAEFEKTYQQPLYTGDWKDILRAPFDPKNITTPWFYIPVGLSTAYLYWSYRHADAPTRRAGQSNWSQDALFGFTQGVGVPLGSAFGEEALWRGFFQREFYRYTDSFAAALLMQTAIFTAAHTPSLRKGAALGGLYFGLYAHHTNGNLEGPIAPHFWIDFISAMFTWMTFRKSEGRGAPLSVSFQFPLL